MNANSIARDDYSFLLEKINLVTPLLRPFVQGRYFKEYEENHVAANLHLLRTTNKLQSELLKCDVENIEFHVSTNVRKMKGLTTYTDYIPESVYSVVRDAKVDMPDPKKHTVQGIIARLQSPDWWTRQLYIQHLRMLEESAIKLGKVHAKSDKYISAEAIKLYRNRQRRNKALLEKMHAINIETGEAFSLADAAKRSVSNPMIRRFEMMNRISGMDEAATLDGKEAVFYTLTAPSRQHAVKHKDGNINKKFTGDTPRDTHKDLCKKWARVRSAANKKDLDFTGVRVTEPHHDGTPHWHMLVFTEKHNIPAMTKLMKKYYLDDDDPNEKGAQKRRVTVELIDKKRGSAVGYVAKYISKNIDGYGMDELEVSEAERCIAWSSLWGIRQFQFFGGPSVTVWRQIRAVKEVDVPDCFKQLHGICISSDWVGYMAYSEENDVKTVYETKHGEGVYGDDVDKKVGVELNDEVLITSGDEYVFEFFDSKTDETIEYRF